MSPEELKKLRKIYKETAQATVDAQEKRDQRTLYAEDWYSLDGQRRAFSVTASAILKAFPEVEE